MDVEKKLTGYPSIDKPWLKYYSEEAINAPLPECTIYEYIWNNNKDHLNNIALNYFDRKITYKELFESIEKTAKAFTAMGVKEGDIVVTATVTTPETVYILYALNRIGAIPNMVDPRTAVEGIREYIKEVNAEYVITLEVAYPKIAKAIEGTSVKKILVTSPADSLPAVKKFFYKMANHSEKLSDICVRWNDFIKNGKNADANYAPYKKDTCCVIVHTGGTTGSPKGVMLSNDNLNAASYQALNSPILMETQDKFLNILPPFIAYGMVLGIHTAVSASWHSVIIPKFDVNEFDKLLLKYHPAGIMGVPTYFEKIMESTLLKEADLSFLKVVLVGGDRTSIEFENRVNEYFHAHGCEIHLSKGYSMTEASSTATISFESANKVGTNGVPLGKTIISAFDTETYVELSCGEDGELCMKTPTMMLGYYSKPTETAEVLKKHNDGTTWLHTGDIGHVDENGFITVNGRVKRLIIRYDGFKVFPTFIENVVLSHEAVENGCAVGLTDKDHVQGKLPVVFVVCKESFKGTEEQIVSELKELCKNELPEYSQPIDFRFCDSLPLTSIGKIDYRTLEKMAEEQINS